MMSGVDRESPGGNTSSDSAHTSVAATPGPIIPIRMMSSAVLRRRFRYLLFAATAMIIVVVFYLEIGWDSHAKIVAHSDDVKTALRRDANSSRGAFNTTVSKNDLGQEKAYVTSQAGNPKAMGKANMHVFDEWCGSSIADLRKSRRYPLYPHVRTTVRKLAVAPQKTDFGIRIFGYLHPYTDGYFEFALSSYVNSEFWLSTDESPLNVQLMSYVGKTGAEWAAPGEFDKFISQISSSVWLSARKKYFFEVLHKQNSKGTAHVEVAWQLQDQEFVFKVIDSKHISLYVDESDLLPGDIVHIPVTPASYHQSPTEQQRTVNDMLKVDHRDTLYQVPLINSSFLQNVLPDCPYKPSYIIRGQPVIRYQGKDFVALSHVYPNDHTRITNTVPENSCYYQDQLDLSQYMKLDENQTKWDQTFTINEMEFRQLKNSFYDCTFTGNRLLHANDTLPVVHAFMEELNKKHQQRFTLVRVVNVVKHMDLEQGSRYLLELHLTDRDGKVLRLSHYIYSVNQKKNTANPYSLNLNSEPTLCNPVGFRLNMAATVHIIVPVKNQAAWVHLLIADVERMYRDTGDTNFNLIICDYSSTDMDVKAALEKSSLPSYDYLRLNGNFQRTGGLQAGIDFIKDSHSIVLLFDLHIEFPSSLIDTVRKHCVEGHMVFSPLVLRLECGIAGYEAKGFWEVYGYGLLGIYKSDLHRVGGMNTNEFKDRWGFEDWELIDRVVGSGMELDRLHLRNLVHYHHSKRGMWNDQNQ